MTETWIAIGVVLLAVLTGFLLPVLIQLMQTLRSARKTLDEVQRSALRINQIGGTLQHGSERAVALLDEMGELAVDLRRLRQTVRTATAVGSAVGPAIAAAVQAFRECGESDAVVEETEETSDERQ